MKLIYLIIALCLCISCQKQEEAVTLVKKDLVASVYASASITPKNIYTLFPQTTGIIENIYVEVGDEIDAGDILAQIQAEKQKLNQQTAELQLRLAQERQAGTTSELRSLKNEYQTALDQLQQDSINYIRQKKLWEQSIGSKLTLEQKALAYRRAQKHLSSLAQQIKLKEVSLKNQVAISRNQLNASKIQTEDTEIRAFHPGKIYSLNFEEGELINPQQPFATIGAKDDFIIELEIDERDIKDIQLGQTVLLLLDAFEDQVLHAYIDKIYPTKKEQSQSYLAEALFDSIPNGIYPGMTGEANIVIQKYSQIWVLDRDYLIDGNHVQTAEGVRKVKTGVSNYDYIEIVDGIDSTTQILKPES